jgi:TolB-like protein
MVRLVDVGDGHRVWSQCHERVEDGFETLDALAMEVVEALRGTWPSSDSEG